MDLNGEFSIAVLIAMRKSERASPTAMARQDIRYGLGPPS